MGDVVDLDMARRMGLVFEAPDAPEPSPPRTDGLWSTPEADVWLQARRILGRRRVPRPEDIVSTADPKDVARWVEDEIRRYDTTTRALGGKWLARREKWGA